MGKKSIPTQESDSDSYGDDGPPHYYDGLPHNTYCSDRKCFLDSEHFTYFDDKAKAIKKEENTKMR